jgi:hypothetical protein
MSDLFFFSEDHRHALVARVEAGGLKALDDLERLHFHAYRYAWRRVRLGDFAQKYQADPRGDWFDGFFDGKAVEFYTDGNGLRRAERRPNPSPEDIAHVEAVCVKIRANPAVFDERNRAAFARPALDPRAPGSSPGQACMGRWLSRCTLRFLPVSDLGFGQSSVLDDPRGARHRARKIALHTCIRQVRVDLDHDAVMRIGGKAPRRQAHSLRRRASHACLGSPPPRIVIGAAVCATRRRNRLLAISFPACCSRRCTQDDTPRDLAGRHQLP